VYSEILCSKVKERRHNGQVFLTTKETLSQDLSDIVRPEDVILCLGAGSISSWAQELPKMLKVADFKKSIAI
jgi:UDP-N-acetylmuramate--alanine ligase